MSNAKDYYLLELSVMVRGTRVSAHYYGEEEDEESKVYAFTSREEAERLANRLSNEFQHVVIHPISPYTVNKYSDIYKVHPSENA